MQSISEIIQAIAWQRGRGDPGPLVMLRQLDSAPGERISHLPIEGELAHAWVALTGEPFRPHQAQALAALRRGEPVALCAASPDVVMTAYLLLYATLLADPLGAALVLAPDDPAAQVARARLDQLNRDLPRNLRLSPTLVQPDHRPDLYARIVVATPETLHGRLLRHHDRAWRLFWPRLRVVALPDIHRYAGVTGAHLADLLLRLQRIAADHAGGHVPNVLATLAQIDDPEPALRALLGQPWRVIAANDDACTATTLAVWRGAAGRLRESVEIATAIRRQGYHVHIVCGALETALVAAILGDIQGISYGPDTPPGHVLVAAGYPGSHSALRRLLRAGYQAVIVVLGDLPHEQALAQHGEALLSDPATNWPPPGTNAYVTAQHVLCAASEQPLTEAEVEAWGAQDIVARLVAQHRLVDLPDPEVAWKPTDDTGDPYSDFSMLSSSGGPIFARTEQSHVVSTLEPTGFERWMFPNAALPPGAGGFRVLARDEDAGSVVLRLESSGRRTYPLRRCRVGVREERDTRALASGRRVGWGRVVIDEEIYGYREATAAAAPAEVALKEPLTARWIAPACWFEVAVDLQVSGQMIGWSLAAALPLRALAAFTDVVPCYDHEARRLYVIDAQPGGNGLSAWVYAHAEDLLPLAYDVALACRNDLLLEPLSRPDMDWLLALLGRRREESATRERPRPAESGRAPVRVEAPIRPELVEGPPPATPRVILTPAPPDIPAPRPRQEEPPAARPPPASEERRQEPPSRARPPLDEQAPARGREQPRGAPGDRRAPPRPVPPSAQPDLPNPERAAERRPAEPPAAQPSRTQPPRRESLDSPGRAAPPNSGTSRDDDSPPDPAALIARLRRQREQREAQQGAQGRNRDRHRDREEEHPATESRFAAGERVFCLPYGDGIVRASRVEGGRELLTVAFPEHGELTIDPAVSLVRKIEDATPDEEEPL